MKTPDRNNLILIAVLAVVGAGLGYQYWQTHQALLAVKTELANATSTVAELEDSASLLNEERATLAEALDTEQRRNDSFEERITTLAGTVGKLDKLAELDPVLLQKYSKVYFLNENYIPSELSEIGEEYRFNEDKLEEIQTPVWPYLEELLEDAKDDDIELLVASSYRSFGQQGSLKASYSVRYGSGANAFSADQGYSEHQLGTTIDFTTTDVGGSFVSFDRSEAYRWLEKNAYKYGFILSYPRDNTYYVYEPWHWRFVGKALADELHDKEKYFYDLDQREIDKYLINIFD